MGAVEEDLVDTGVVGFEAATEKDDDAVPLVEAAGIAVEVEEAFAEEAVVEGVVFLELDFAEADDLGLGIGRGEEDAIYAEGGFFDFDGLEAIALALTGVEVEQGEEEAGAALEKLVEDGVAAHGWGPS